MEIPHEEYKQNQIRKKLASKQTAAAIMNNEALDIKITK